MSVSVNHRGIEIDQGGGDKVMSASAEGKGTVGIDIGEDFAGRHQGPERPQGFQRYTSMTLNADEVVALHRWLGSVIKGSRMRNLHDYPVTYDEIVETLERLRDRELEGLAPGDMTCVVLREAIESVHRLRDLER